VRYAVVGEGWAAGDLSVGVCMHGQEQEQELLGRDDELQ